MIWQSQTVFRLVGFIRRSATVALQLALIGGVTAFADKVQDERSPSQQSWELIDNSETASQVIALNQLGHVVGIRDVPMGNIGLESAPFIYIDGQQIEIPKPTGFTNLMPEAISDRGQVVGYVSRVIGHPEGSLRGFVFQTENGQIRVLPPLEGHRASHAFDISDDGTVISGCSTGRDPPRMVPCVWTEDNGQWHAESLPAIYDFNPYLLTSRVVISGDGRHIAGCLTVDIVPGDLPRYINHLFEWTQRDNGHWELLARSDRGVELAGINNQQMIAGTCRVNRQRRPFVLDSAGEFQVLDLLEADVSGRAADIDNHGRVVGYSDDPPGPQGGPQAFIWSQGSVQPIVFPRPVVYSSAAAINDKGQIAGFVEPTVEDSEQDKIIAFVLSDETAGHSSNAP